MIMFCHILLILFMVFFRALFRTFKLCLYVLHLSAILKYHKIGYHVYANDIQLYISFKCRQPLEAFSKVNICLSVIGGG